MHRQHVLVASVILSALALTSCLPEMTAEKLKEMMSKKPAELEKLNVFAGKWADIGKANILGLDIETTFTSDTKWGGNGWYLVFTRNFTMEGFDDVEFVETWTYDQHDKVYRYVWVDSMGSSGFGKAWLDERINTWQIRGSSHGSFGPTKMTGWIKFIDDNTIEWKSTEYAYGLIKIMELTGTSRRVNVRTSAALSP